MDGNISGVVSGDFVLFEGVFVFFVEDDQTELRNGCEDGAAWSYDDLGFSVCDTSPLEIAFGSAHIGVKDGDGLKTVFESASSLRCKADFGDENDGLSTELDRSFDGLHVDFGFAAAGDTVQKDGGVFGGVECGEDCLQSDALVGG
jgi:hypothetical protein